MGGVPTSRSSDRSIDYVYDSRAIIIVVVREGDIVVRAGRVRSIDYV